MSNVKLCVKNLFKLSLGSLAEYHLEDSLYNYILYFMHLICNYRVTGITTLGINVTGDSVEAVI